MTVSKTSDYDEPSTPTPAGTIGCFKDTSDDRIMDLKLESDIMTNPVSARSTIRGRLGVRAARVLPSVSRVGCAMCWVCRTLIRQEQIMSFSEHKRF